MPFRPLVPDPQRSIGASGENGRLDGNLIIHGDNLHALKALLPLYAGKVDCIFIDPPYNTGNEGWCYNDKVNSPMMREWLAGNPVGIEDGLRHDKYATYRDTGDPRGPWRPNNLSARNFYSKGTYAIHCPSGRVIAGPPQGRYWAMSEEKFWEMDRAGRIWWGEDGNNIPAPKIFLREVKDGRVPQTFWDWTEVGHTQDAK